MAYIKTPQGAYFEQTGENQFEAVKDPNILKQLNTGKLSYIQKDIYPPTQTTTTPEKTFGVSGASASFLAGTQDILSKLSSSITDTASLYPSPAQAEAELSKSLELAKQRTQTSYDITREEILKSKEWAQQQIAPLREQIAGMPALSKRQLDDFSIKVEKIADQTNKALERLNLEEQQALDNLDYNYANQIRQAKLDYINFQKSVLENQLNLLTTAYNIQQSVKSEQRQEMIDAQTMATNVLNTILSSYAGRGIDYTSIPYTVREKLESAANVLGIPVDALKEQIATRQANLDIVREGDYTSVYDKNTGELVKRYYAPSASETEIKESDVSAFISKSFAVELKDKNRVSIDTYASAFSLWQEQFPNKIKDFFLNYPLEVYVATPTNDKELEIYNMINKISEKVMSSSESAMLQLPAEIIKILQNIPTSGR